MAFQKLDFIDPTFWPTIKGATGPGKVGKFVTSNDLIFVTLPNSAVMTPIVRTKSELFTKTIKTAQARDGHQVIINAQLYDVTRTGKMDAAVGSDPVPAGETTPQGRSIAAGKVLAGRISSQMFFIAYSKKGKPPYSFGFGSAPTHTDSAVGGAGPLIVNRRPYAAQNSYSDPVVQVFAPKSGPPGPAYEKHLVHRSNATFKSLAAKGGRVGKVIVAHSVKHSILCILCQTHAKTTASLEGIRNDLLMREFENAIFFDGSDSVTLMVGSKMIVRPNSNKNETNVTGIGFK